MAMREDTRIAGKPPLPKYIPTDLVRCYNLEFPTVLRLVDPLGREFHTMRTSWRDRRVIYRGGWRALCKVNLAIKDDKLCQIRLPKLYTEFWGRKEFRERIKRHLGYSHKSYDTDDNDDPTTEEENRVDDHPQVVQVKNDTENDHSVPRTEVENQRFDFFEALEMTDVDQERTQQEGRRDDNPQPELVRGGTTNTCKRKMKKDHDWFGVEIFKTGLIPLPKNPYFVTKKRRTRAGELKIPPAFIQSIKGKWSMTVALRDRYNNLWLVKVEEVGGHWYFKDGWTKFMEENMVNGGDMFVYEYFSKGLFDFKVHDGSGCMIRGAGGPITELQNMKIEPDDDAVSDDDSDYDAIIDVENGQHDYHEGEQAMNDDTDDNGDPTTEEENRVDDHPQAEQVKNDQERTQQEGRRDDNPQPELVRGGTTNTCKRKMKRDHDWFGVEIFKTGLIPQPKNPYFMTKKRRTRAGELYIPMDVIKAYNLKLPAEVLLCDLDGRKSSATRKVWADERTFYVGGWKPLCRINFVGDEDSCICEFVQNDDGFCISVSFFPPKRRQK